MKTNKRLRVAIVGSGNIGTDLMYKVLHSPRLELGMVAGIVPESEGLKRASSLGIPATAEGIGPVLERDDIRLCLTPRAQSRTCACRPC